MEEEEEDRRGRGPQDGSETVQNALERAPRRPNSAPERSSRSCSRKAVREHDSAPWRSICAFRGAFDDVRIMFPERFPGT